MYGVMRRLPLRSLGHGPYCPRDAALGVAGAQTCGGLLPGLSRHVNSENVGEIGLLLLTGVRFMLIVTATSVVQVG
jgi:hypothetical protein